MDLPWIPADLLRRISSSRTHDECSALLTELDPAFAGTLPVQLQGRTLHDQVLTDVDGYFGFEGLAPGTYELSAELPQMDPRTGGSTLLRASSRVELAAGSETVRLDLCLRESLVAIRGRVLDSLGAPIAGVSVEGRVVPIERHDLVNDDVETPFAVRAETDANGEYALLGFAPPPLYDVACFLLGVRSDFGMAQVDVGVSDEHFESVNATRVIVMTEALSHAAAPLADVLHGLPRSVGFPVRRPGTVSPELYSSKSNVILGVDVVADPRR